MRTVINAYSHPHPGTDDTVLSQSFNDMDATLRAQQEARRQPKPWRPRCELNRRRWLQPDPEPEDEWEIVSDTSLPEEDNAAPARGRVTIVIYEDKEDERRRGNEEAAGDPFPDGAAVDSATSSSSSPSSSSNSANGSNEENESPVSAHSPSISRVPESPTLSDLFADANVQALSSYDSRSSSISKLSLPADWTDNEHVGGVETGRGGLQTRRDSREVTRLRLGERAARLRETAARRRAERYRQYLELWQWVYGRGSCFRTLYAGTTPCFNITSSFRHSHYRLDVPENTQ